MDFGFIKTDKIYGFNTAKSVHEISEFARMRKANLIVVGHKHLDSWAARSYRMAPTNSAASIESKE